MVVSAKQPRETIAASRATQAPQIVQRGPSFRTLRLLSVASDLFGWVSMGTFKSKKATDPQNKAYQQSRFKEKQEEKMMNNKKQKKNKKKETKDRQHVASIGSSP
eukprot:375997-Amphidinium_carterae.1